MYVLCSYWVGKLSVSVYYFTDYSHWDLSSCKMVTSYKLASLLVAAVNTSQIYLQQYHVWWNTFLHLCYHKLWLLNAYYLLVAYNKLALYQAHMIQCSWVQSINLLSITSSLSNGLIRFIQLSYLKYQLLKWTKLHIAAK